jgi:hypothetical protein
MSAVREWAASQNGKVLEVRPVFVTLLVHHFNLNFNYYFFLFHNRLWQLTT